MICETITLSSERNVYFETFMIDNSQEFQSGITRPLIIICPGGGYSYLSDREGEPIARAFLAAGYQTIVLHYGIDSHAVMPGPLHDIAQTVAYARAHSAEWNVNPDQIFVCGFSAGAHVAASLGVFWNHSELLPDFADNADTIRPNGMILCYPVLDLKSSATHLDIGCKPGMDIHSIELAQKHPKMPLEKIFIMDETEHRYFVDFEHAMNAYIFGGDYTDKQEEFYCLQNHVSSNTPPAFIWHTAEDGLILPSNSLKFAEQLNAAHVPYELHIYGEGGHGTALSTLATANDRYQWNPASMSWMQRAIDWIDRSTGFSESIRSRFPQ